MPKTKAVFAKAGLHPLSGAGISSDEPDVAQASQGGKVIVAVLEAGGPLGPIGDVSRACDRARPIFRAAST
jgi:hypothetical protein